MIVFCEDCGQRNHLADGLSDDGKAVFTCQDCGYKNAYVLESKSLSVSARIDTSLKKILAGHPNLIGSFILNTKSQKCISHMPANLRDNDLFKLGTSLSQSLSIGCRYFPDTVSLTVNISDKLLFVVSGHAHILVVVTKGREISNEMKTQITHLFNE